MSAELVFEEALVVTVEEAGDAVVIAAFGEIDAATREQLWVAVDGALNSGRSVEIDMSGVSFIDASGLRVLIAAKNSAVRSNRTVRVSMPSSAVTRLLQLTDQYERFVHD